MDRMEKYKRDIQHMGKLEEAFADTCRMLQNVEPLIDSVKRSMAMQEVILETDNIMNIPVPHKNGKVVISRKKTLEAASAYKGKKVAVLNFGSARCPGGMHVARGTTQEECLCRETTLYPCINHAECMERFYRPHGTLNDLYNADMIYTPAVTVFKTHDEIPECMLKTNWYEVDVITMAAPNITRLSGLKDEDLVQIFEERFTRILKIAFRHDVDVLILGAFGCGEFGNDPAIVATGAGRALEKYHGAFDTVEFAVYEEKAKKKYRMFRLILDRYVNSQ